MLTRRHLLTTAMTGAAVSVGGTMIRPFTARAQGAGDVYETDGGQIEIFPIQHASFVMQTPQGVIYNDPVGGPELYDGQPEPDLILITHEHGDHFDVPTLEGIVGEETALVVNPRVMGMLPDALKERATEMANGDSGMVLDSIGIDAVPAYNTTEDRKKYHPEGRDNGYVLTIDGRRIYIAGDTEGTPTMRDMTDIMVAFVPMNLPYTMAPEAAAEAVNAFQPQNVYPYHYRGSDPQVFADLVEGPAVKMGPWYDSPQG